MISSILSEVDVGWGELVRRDIGETHAVVLPVCS